MWSRHTENDGEVGRMFSSRLQYEYAASSRSTGSPAQHQPTENRGSESGEVGTHACWPYTPLYTIATKSRTYPPRCHKAFFLIGMRQGYSRYGMEDGVVCETTKVTTEPSNQATKVNSPSRLGKFGRENFTLAKSLSSSPSIFYM